MVRSRWTEQWSVGPDRRPGQKDGCVRKKVLDRDGIRDGVTELNVLLDDVEHAVCSSDGLRMFTVQRWGRTPQATVDNCRVKRSGIRHKQRKSGVRGLEWAGAHGANERRIWQSGNTDGTPQNGGEA